jgi:hypothetical protein
MTQYEVYIEDEPGVFRWLGRNEARSGKAAIALSVAKPQEGKQYVAVPTRNLTFSKPKTKPAQVTWT